jgi:hypothetical protein
MSEGKGVALAILGIVALIAVVGLVLLFSGKMTGNVVAPGAEIYGGYGANKLYGGNYRVQESAPRGAVSYPETYKGGHVANPNQGTYVKGVPVTWEGQVVSVVGGSQSIYREPTRFTTCPAGLDRMGSRQMQSLSDAEFVKCVDGGFGDDSMCCPTYGLDSY